MPYFICIPLAPGDSGVTSNDTVQISMKDLAEKSQTVTDIEHLNLQLFPKDVSFEVHTVSNDCELRVYVENTLKLEFKRGCVFYEFIHDFEDISEDKEVIFYSTVRYTIALKYVRTFLS